MPRWLHAFLLIVLALTALLFAQPLDPGRPSGAADRYSRAELDAVTALLHGGDTEATDNLIHLRGVANSGETWTETLSDFRAGLPDDIVLIVDVFVVDEDLPLDSLCQQMFASLSLGPVEFLESGTRLRTASYASLDRMASFASDCPSTLINITGHTDSTGLEMNNRKLSRARAQAVAAYLVERGAMSERLFVSGAGSSRPIADNDTRIGRERNRRIEFSLRAAAD